MKRTFIILSFIMMLICGADLRAQDTFVVPEGYVLVDSVVYRPAATVDTTLAGKDVFLVMPQKDMFSGKPGVKINQTGEVRDAMRRHVSENGTRTMSGYRVRIFFDNKQTARVESEETLKRFESMYHDVVAYRTYANPYFKVTVGDFRTRSEAVRLLERIRGAFPSAFVVKENIEFPVVDKENAYVTDTIKVLRPKVGNI
jgi:phosphate-selective porin